jgi:hypothetical protein
VDFEYGNITAQELFDLIESAIAQNPDAAGVQLDDIHGRSWFIELLNGNNSKIN